jgi:hypothetical protein
MKVPFIPYVQGRNRYIDTDGKHYGWAIHNTSNATATAKQEAAYAARRTDGVSSNFYHDKVDVIQSIDTNDKCGHAGSKTGNENAMCSEFSGLNSNTRAWWLANVNWERTGRVIAYVLDNDPDYVGFQVRRASVQEMKDNPKVKAFYSHDDMRRAWGGTTHTDPGNNFPWDKLFEVVNKYKNGGGGMADYTEAQMRAFTWQYGGAGIGENTSSNTDGKNRSTLSYFDEVLKTVRLIAQQVNIDPAELKAIQEAAEAGAKAAMLESVDDIVNGVLAGLPEGTLTKADVEDALRNVLINGVGTQA